jgi:hypothetical protein
VVRQINTAGIISRVAGNGTPGSSGDGGQALSAKLSYPGGLANDNKGNLYISSYQHSLLRKVNGAQIISKIAGTGISGCSGDGDQAMAAEIYPQAIAVDNAGNIYIADDNDYRIRKIDVAGIITTIAGTGVAGYTADGGLVTAAKIYDPMALAVDAAGNVYFTEYNNNFIRKINLSGVLSTVAGSGAVGFSGDGGLAT